MASTDPLGSLTGAATKGAGNAVDFLTAKRVVSMVVVPSGTVTGGQVAMEASHDGTNWVVVQVVDPLQGVNRSSHVIDGAYRYWRSNLTAAITGGGSVTTTFMEAG